MSDAEVNRLAGDLAEYLGEQIVHDPECWSTTEDVDQYVIDHVQRLDIEGQRRMRAIATTLLGLTASALARAGTAPWAQEVISDNPNMAAMVIQIEPPEGHDLG